MAIEDALRALRDHWDDVVARLGARRAQKLRELAGELGGPGHKAAVTRMADLLVEDLPPDHPVRRALAEGYLLAPSVVDWADLQVSLSALPLRLPEAAPGGYGPVMAGVLARLLSAPALSEHEVRRRGADPADPGLIRLDRPDGSGQWPAFQFQPEDGLLPVVRAVNDLLGAHSDPVGAADWWLSRNAWLNGQPSSLIGIVPDDHLVRAARALSAEV